MAVLYIHIGMSKTGTTAIQNFLYTHCALLKKQGVIYPDFELKNTWESRSINAFWLTYKGYQEETAQRYFEKINQYADRYSKIILSDEILWYRGNNPNFWRNLKSHLRSDIEIRVIAYIRRQDLYLHSYWEQRVKIHQPMEFKTDTFREFMNDYFQKNTDALLDYKAYFQSAVSILGKENVLVRVFERGQFEKNSLYADFFRTIGVTLDDTFQVPEDLTNISIRGSVLETKRYLNYIPEFSQREYHLLPYLERVQKRMESEGNLTVRNDFTQQERIEFLKKYEASNEWVAKNLLGREDGILFLEPVSEDRGEPGDYTAGEVAEVCGYLMLDMMRQINEQKKEISRMKKKTTLKQTLPDKKQTIRRMLKKLRVSE